MEKKIEILRASTLRKLVELMNKEKVKKEDVVQFISTADDDYIVMLYK